MNKKSVAFEQEIHRLHELVERSGAEVTWNDYIPDPDNPSQPRQIDITVRRDGALTIVECRLQKNRQSVKWIEELIGRRSSLRAASAIAVLSARWIACLSGTSGRCGRGGSIGLPFGNASFNRPVVLTSASRETLT